MSRDVVVSFWLDEDLYTRLKTLAKERGTTVSMLIREAIRRYVESLGYNYPCQEHDDEVSGISD